MQVRIMMGWGGVAALCAIAFGFVTGVFNPDEKVNALWLVVAAVCFYTLARRFYGRFLASRVMELDDARLTPAHRLNDGANFYPANKYVLIRPSLRRDRRRRTLTRARVGCAVRIFAGVFMAGHRRGVGRCGARLHHFGRLDATEWPLSP